MSKSKDMVFYDYLMEWRGHHVSIFWDGGASSGALTKKVLKNGDEYWQVKWKEGWFQFQLHSIKDMDFTSKRITCSQLGIYDKLP